MRLGLFFGWHPAERGGSHTFQREILRGLRESSESGNHHLTLFVSRKTFSDLLQEVPSGSEVIDIGVPSLIGRGIRRLRRDYFYFHHRLAWSRRIERLCRKHDVDLLWFVDPLSAEIMDGPYIATVFDLQHRLQPWFPEVSSDGQWAAREAYYETWLRRASYVITGSETGKREISSFYQIPAERIRILPHPTPHFTTDMATIAVRELYGLRKPFIFYPAQFWPHKNHVNLLRALALLPADGKSALDLVLVGSDKGNLSHVRSEAAALGISGRVHFLGFVPRENLASLYREAVALVYLSYFGPDNLPPLEAFALGCPVVASAISGAEEQLGDAAVLVDPSDPKNIADAIRRVSSDHELRARLIGSGSARALRWGGREFVATIWQLAEEFESVRRCWR
jgi:glycosyltransferase involved in cell wall biosynthesis